MTELLQRMCVTTHPGWHCFVDDGSPQRRTVFSVRVSEGCAAKTRGGQMACRSVCLSGVPCLVSVVLACCASCAKCARCA